MRTIYWILCFAFAAMASAHSAVTGSSACVGGETIESSDCILTWKWEQAPRGRQWIQAFEPRTKTWNMVAETAAVQQGEALDSVPRGRLYRLRSCDDPMDAESCIVTSAVWPYVQPPEEDIPPKLVTETGDVVNVQKGLSYSHQLRVYNVVQLSGYFLGMKWDEIVPISRPARRSTDAVDMPLPDLMDNFVFDYIEQLRLPPVVQVASGEQVPPTSPRPEWIGDVPAGEQAQFRAGYLRAPPVEESAIIFSPDKPKYSITVFADVTCVHCERMMQDMPKINAAGIRVKWLANPLAGPYSEGGRKMADIWCSPDRNASLKRALSNGTVQSASCPGDLVVRQYALAKRLGLYGSPVVLTESGEIIGGYASSEDLIASVKQHAK